MTDTAEHTDQSVRWLTEEEARARFDEEARRVMGMSGEEFLRRWAAGEFDAIADDPDHPEIMELHMIEDFGR